MAKTASPASPDLSLQFLWQRLPALVLMSACLFLCLVGLLMLYSIGHAHSGIGPGIFYKQVIWAGFALFAFGLAATIDLEWLRRWSVPLAVVGIILLLLVLVPAIGLKVNGARRWIPLGPMNMQVSDMVKVCYLLLMAHYLADYRRIRDRFWQGFVAPMAIVGIPFILIMLQPDFGTAFLFALVGGTLLFLAGLRMSYLVPSAVVGLSGFALMVVLDPIRWQRIVSFLYAEENRSEGAYQLWQGILGFGAGGVAGVGLGNGRQQIAFLPEAHTDFIFPIIGEELGFVMTALVLLAFAVLFVFGWRQLDKAPNLYQYLLCGGALLFVSYQALINMGVATGVLPTKGMSLPLISYGGSNLVATALLLGLVVNGCFHWTGTKSIRAREVKG